MTNINESVMHACIDISLTSLHPITFICFIMIHMIHKGATTLRPKFFVLAGSFFRDLSIWKSWISSFQRYQTCQFSYGKIVETIDLKIHGEYTGPIWIHVFTNRLFPLFFHMKIQKFGIAEKRRFSSFIWRGRKKNFQPKKKFSA